MQAPSTGPAPREVRPEFIVWGVLMVGLLVVFATRVLPALRIETDILALLPHDQREPHLDAALDAFSSRIARKQLFLVGAHDTADAARAARAFARVLTDSGAFANVQLDIDAGARNRFAVYLQHREWLLSQQMAAQLEHESPEALTQRAIRAAYSPANMMQPLGLAEDPVGILNDFLRGQIPRAGAARLEGSLFVVDRGDESFVVIASECAGSPFAQAVQERVLPAIERARAAARGAVTKPIEILSSGTILHAAAATQRATHEVTTFGTIELIGVMLLLWTILGVLRPLVLGALTLTLATIAAVVVVHYTFGTVHILALVFGSSLIGSVIDYSIHFFADRFREPGRWSPLQAVRHVRPALLLGLSTTLIGYIALAVVPFPGLQQIAVFCMSGLVVGCLTVINFYPMLTPATDRPAPRFGPAVASVIDGFVGDWRWRGWRLALLIALSAAVVAGLYRVKIEDDVRSLQQSPPDLMRNEKVVRELLGGAVESRFFVVTAANEQAVLEREQQLAHALDQLVARGALQSYDAVSRSLPSIRQQQHYHTLLEERVYAPDGVLPRVMRQLGFEEDAIARREQAFAAAREPLTPQTWLASPAAGASRHLWLGQIGTRHASVVTLAGIRDVQQVAASSADLDGVRFVDPIAAASDVLLSYRRAMSALLIGVYLAAGAVLALRFGWRDAVRMVTPAAAATAATVGLFGLIGTPVNLFTLLALWLVLGLSIDYGIFLRHGADARVPAVLSITLSACTTLLAFGLLVFSATPFIHMIGLTLLCSITFSWLLVLFTCPSEGGARASVQPKTPHHG